MKLFKRFTIVCIFVLNTAGYAQTTIDSLHLIPANPQSSDAARIICYATLSSSDCWLEKSNISINDSTIDISSYYFRGGYEAICNSIDTFSLGSLSAGNYMLKYHLYDSSGTSNKFTLEDTDTITFSVAEPRKTVDSVANYLTGEWIWTRSCGGIVGDCNYSDSVTTKKIVFDKLANVQDSLAYSFFQSDTVVSSGNAKISYSTSIYGEYWNLEGVDGFPTQKLTIFFNATDTISLNENCYDCYSHVFVRKSKIGNSIFDIQRRNNSFKVYPNPTSGELYFDLPHSVILNSIAIIDLKGKIRKKISFKTKEKVNISDLPDGVYNIKITTDNNIFNSIIIKE